ncbi:hypothetical protein DPMN_135130 [Dreissena polymorpha]|uniref:Uncharacterized protein n=1 Tax=Dreissena polymorpha TaxID=45954 RepID=A0A9D4FYF6_DREPO|nr:hypothetical protein DPMN_135130 [Dreissena polymorpha]
MSPKVAPHLQYGVQDQGVRPEEHDCNTYWSTRVPADDRHTTKAGLIWTRHQARFSVKDCPPGHARGRSTSTPSTQKLY